MMSDIIFESIRAIVLLGIIVCLVRAGKARKALAQEGWGLIIAGFVLLFVGTLFDITDNFQQLNQFIIIGDTEVQAFFEKIVGSLGGFVAIAVGLIKWLPTVTGVKQLRNIAEQNADVNLELAAAHNQLKVELRDSLEEAIDTIDESSVEELLGDIETTLDSYGKKASQ
jgi:hypothetical protein